MQVRRARNGCFGLLPSVVALAAAREAGRERQGKRGRRTEGRKEGSASRQTDQQQVENGSCIFLGDQIGPNWNQNCEESWRLRQGSVSCNSCQSKSDSGMYLACHRLIAAPILLPPCVVDDDAAVLDCAASQVDRSIDRIAAA